MTKAKTTNMKTKLASLLQSLALLALLVTAALPAGCNTPAVDGTKKPVFFFLSGNTNNIEAKAFRGTRLIVFNVLKERGTNAIPKMRIASDDLKILEAAPVITPAEVLEILNRAKVLKNPDTLFYIQEGIFLITDEAGTIGAQNPEQLRAVARGGWRGIDSMLGN